MDSEKIKQVQETEKKGGLKSAVNTFANLFKDIWGQLTPEQQTLLLTSAFKINPEQVKAVTGKSLDTDQLLQFLLQYKGQEQNKANYMPFIALSAVVVLVLIVIVILFVFKK